jgi:hypothetical protein
VVKCSDISEECGASIFMVTELVQVNDVVIQRKKICYLCRMVRGSPADHNYGRHPLEPVQSL